MATSPSTRVGEDDGAGESAGEPDGAAEAPASAVASGDEDAEASIDDDGTSATPRRGRRGAGRSAGAAREDADAQDDRRAGEDGDERGRDQPGRPRGARRSSGGHRRGAACVADRSRGLGRSWRESSRLRRRVIAASLSVRREKRRPVRAGGRGARGIELSGGGPDRIRTGDLQRDRLACWAATPRVLGRWRMIAGTPRRRHRAPTYTRRATEPAVERRNVAREESP